MKRALALILSLICILALTYCTGGKDPNKEIGAYIDKNVKKVKVNYVRFGHDAEWTFEGEAIQPLRDWLRGLQCEYQEFEEHHTPGDNIGGEAYVFEPEGGKAFFYGNYGRDGTGKALCYLCTEKGWYFVKNPSDPPVREH